MQFEAKPTAYKGVEMRSLLEARWAASLDHMGIAWEYEPTTFRLPSGIPYTPDFTLTGLGTIIEVKGMGVGRVNKPRELAAEMPGVIFILGFEPARRYVADCLWRPFIQWRDALGYDTRLAQCAACSKWQWMRPQISRRCRLCAAHHEGFLAGPGEIEFTEPAGTPFLDSLLGKH